LRHGLARDIDGVVGAAVGKDHEIGRGSPSREEILPGERSKGAADVGGLVARDDRESDPQVGKHHAVIRPFRYLNNIEGCIFSIYGKLAIIYDFISSISRVAPVFYFTKSPYGAW